MHLHTTLVIPSRLCTRLIEVMKWPFCSPDLNPIEQLWAIMKDWITEHSPDYTRDQAENKFIIEEIWDAILLEHLYNLAASMPDRMQAVVDANGWHTRY